MILSRVVSWTVAVALILGCTTRTFRVQTADDYTVTVVDASGIVVDASPAVVDATRFGDRDVAVLEDDSPGSVVLGWIAGACEREAVVGVSGAPTRIGFVVEPGPRPSRGCMTASLPP